MTDFTCLTCQVELMEHPAGKCLSKWVHTAIMRGPYAVKEPILWLCYSEDIRCAWEVMQKVWEMDPDATIYNDLIQLGIRDINQHEIYDFKCITGLTFPLRVCRAALWLALTQKEHPK